MWRTIALALIFCLTPCRTAVVPQLSLSEMVSRSECIVEATVRRSWASWDPAHRFIWTHYELSIHSSWKGAPASSTMVVSEPGGTVDGLTMHVGGAVPYLPNEDVMLFLYRTPVGYIRALGNGQGKFTITRHGASGDRYVHANVSGIELTPARRDLPGYAAAPRETQHLDGMRLVEFQSRVRRLLGGRETAKVTP